MRINAIKHKSLSNESDIYVAVMQELYPTMRVIIIIMMILYVATDDYNNIVFKPP